MALTLFPSEQCSLHPTALELPTEKTLSLHMLARACTHPSKKETSSSVSIFSPGAGYTGKRLPITWADLRRT